MVTKGILSRVTFVNCNKWWVLCLVLLTSSAWAGDKRLACDPESNLCTVVAPLNYCSAGEVTHTKWDIRSGTYILSCECNCTAQENSFWLVGTNGNVQTLNASEIVSSVDIAKNPSGVPDIFGVVPYCSKLESSADRLIYLQKRPGGPGGAQGYCYSAVDQSAVESCSTTDCLEKQNAAIVTLSIAKNEFLTEFAGATSRLYKDKTKFSLFSRKSFIENYLGSYGYDLAQQQVFNDIGYYWQQAGFNHDAIWLLNKVIENDPQRMVAYLNIADAYWAEGDKATAAKNYNMYAQLMASGGKQQKIPGRVKERVDRP